MIRDIINRAVAGAIAAAAAFVAIVALGATLFYALCIVLPPLGASAITAGVFVVAAGIAYLVFAGKAHGEDDDDFEEEEPETLTSRAMHLVRERPVIGIVAALAAGAVILKKPGLVALAMTAFNESQSRDSQSDRSSGRGRKRRRR